VRSPATFRPWSAAGMTRSRPRWPPPTSGPPSSTPTGRAPAPSSGASTRRSRSPSWRPTRRPRAPPAWASSGWPASRSAHSSCGRRTPAELLARLQSAPVAPNRLDPEILRELVLAQVRLLRTLLASIASLDRAIAALLPEHPKTPLLAALPRLGGGVNLAQVLAEAGPILDRALDVEQAAAECGASPVTKASGTSKSVCFRWAANTRARKALQTFADHSRHRSPWAAQVYAQARARGKRHPHAIRILMRAWLRVIWACWHSGIAYDPIRHGGEQRAAA